MQAGVGDRLASIGAHLQAAHEGIAALLAVVRESDRSDGDLRTAVLQLAELVGRSKQAHDGELVQVLAEAHRLKAAPGGLVPWINTTLDRTQGAARGMAQSAREIGHLPELSRTLSSGRVGASTIRALTRTARAVKGTEQDLSAALAETLDLATTGNVAEANRHVRILEETVDPGSAERRLAQQRARCFLRIVPCESGMTRIEALLDDESAALVRAALDETVSAFLRSRQYDHVELAPEGVTSVEQLQAHALRRFAELWLAADSEQRGVSFTPPVIYNAPLDPTEQAGLAESFDGELVPRNLLPPMGNSAAHLLEHVAGQPVRLDGELIDQDRAARLASAAQRMALAWRDRHCTYPGCERPPTWSLHAHHRIPHSRSGPTTMSNLVLLCSEHHIVAHHPRM